MPLLQVRNFAVTFTLYDVGLTRKRLDVITDLDLDVAAGQVVAVVGASGSGKSLLAHAILGLLPPNATVSGTLLFRDTPLTATRQVALRGKEIALIPQTLAALDPVQRVGPQVRRAAVLRGLTAAQAGSAQDRAFTRYDLAPTTARRYPFQISGGMARRVLLATATVGQAALVVADEPTPGLHPDAVRETLGHLRELADQGAGVILITHDIEAALAVADQVAVFYAGTTVEIAPVGDFAGDGSALRHPYSRALWRALPQNGFQPLPGSQPPPDALPVGCLFADRCPLVTPACRMERPALRAVRGGQVRCIHA